MNVFQTGHSSTGFTIPFEDMAPAKTDISAEKPEEPDRPSNTPILLDGQFDADQNLRAVFGEILRRHKDIKNGMLKILSKEVRGHIGVSNGSIIYGAHVTTTSDYGARALKKLLAVNVGRYTFITLPEQPIELKQLLNIEIDQLLSWRRPDSHADNLPNLSIVVDMLTTHSGRLDAATAAAIKEFQNDVVDTETFMAWGIEQLDELPEIRLPEPEAFNQEMTQGTPHTTAPTSRLQTAPSASEQTSQKTNRLKNAAAITEESKNATGSHKAVKVATSAVADQTPGRRSQTLQPRQLRGNQLKVPAVAETTDNTKLIVGSLVGFIVALLLCQQVFEILELQRKFNMGVKNLQEGNSKSANLKFNNVISKAPDITAAYFYRALARTRSGQLEGALQDYDRVIAREPDNLLAHTGRGSIRIKMKDYDSAIMDCDSILQIDPKNQDAHRLRAIAFSKGGRYKEAIDDATGYLQRVKTDAATGRADILSTRAYAYYKSKKFDEALADYTKAIELNPKVAELYASRAIVNKELHDWSKALADANEALKLNPSNTTVFQLRGICHRAMGDSQKALAELDRAVSLTPTVSMHKMRGQARLEVRDFAGALSDFDYVLSVTPDDREAKVFFDRARLNLRAQAPKPKPSLIK